ncbi:MAG: P-loop NTPase [Elusimicrobia bacterium]|nr:P-loop NTPase [Elusimicrobiota bacterium]
MSTPTDTVFQPSPEALQARKGPSFRRPGPDALANVRNLVAVGSGKGGVGKSTVTTNLAVALQKMGAKVAVLDADIYGPSQPGLMGAGGTRAESENEQMKPLNRHGIGFMSIGLVMPQDGPVVWRAPMAMKALFQFLNNVQWGDLDYLLIDLPPGTGDVQLTIAQQAPLTGSIVVTTPQDVALNVARKGLQMFQQVKVPILGVVENMSGFVCTNCGTEHLVFKKEGGRVLAQEAGTAFLGRIPLETDIMTGGDAGEPLLVRNPETGAARSFLDLARNFEHEVARTNGAPLADEPKNVAIGLDGDLRIEWADGHPGQNAAWGLRVNCPCAGCVDEDTGKRVLDPKRIPLDIKISEVHPVGRYGVGIAFSDSHNTGIFKFDILRAACECPDCVAKKGDSTGSFSV